MINFNDPNLIGKDYGSKPYKNNWIDLIFCIFLFLILPILIFLLCLQ